MINIDWDEFKEFKKYTHSRDNFEITLRYLKSYYNISTPIDVYETLKNDDIGQMMLRKRNIASAEDLEHYLFKVKI
ncbi:hypothetical protein MNB_SM-3-1401 [hydrothermal vent metagenome]|uniref:Uncharacterized protein n=1 Tax=hydrothermal vent metagenome TaxID=652676 RepID=A0A1W1D1J1_9ZZZZ